jgi:hypothetical protein
VYRQEFYQYIEQISKHKWAIDEYEYIVALAGLAFMTDADCAKVGSTSGGATIYAGVAPQQYGKFVMALYTDEYCIEPDTTTGYTYSDLVAQSGIDLGSADNTDDGGDDDGYSWASDDWYATQEYTLTNLNDVYEEFKYCTSCVDYPTYQDGYFIGDDGTDSDDLINQCWKFYSHDSYTCEADCIAKAHAQGTILSVQYGQATFGKTISGFYQETSSSSSKASSADEEESGISRLAANAFLTLSFLLFVATFLAFAVARRSRYRESRSTKSRRLLDDDANVKSSKSRKGSKTKGEGDGIFKGRSGRSKSKEKKSRRSSSKSSKRSKSGSRLKSYEPPSDAKGSNGELAF